MVAKKKSAPKKTTKKAAGTKHTKPDRKDSPDRTDPSTATQFKPGNQAWLARTTFVSLAKYTPDILKAAAYEYFQWVEDNPLLEEKVFHTAGEITRTDVAHIRAMTIGGLCMFLGISQETWFKYAKKPEYVETTREITQAIRKQKFEGAAAEMLSANIIARDLGLVDKKEVEDTTKPKRSPEEVEVLREFGRALADKLK